MSNTSRAVSTTARVLARRYFGSTLLAPAAIVAAGCSYRAGSFADTAGLFPGPHVALPCLDLAVALVHSPSATGPVVQYSFGNRCRNPITVDLAAARVTARDPAGNQVALHPYDPRQEIRPLPLDGLLSGREQIFYLGPAPMSAISICVDFADIDRSAPATSAPICLAEAETEVRL
jgi:hypothetical protein